MMDAVCRGYEDRGLELSAHSAYRGALAAFQAAYARTPAPRLLINMGRSLFHMGRMQEAIEYYERFARADVAPDPEVVQRVQRYVEEAKAALALHEEGSAEIKGSASPEPAPATVSPSAIAALSAVDSPARASRRRPALAASAVLLGMGTASLASGIGLGVRAAELSDAVFGNSGPFNQGLFDQGVAFNRSAITLSVIGGAAVVAGSAWLGVWLARSPKSNAQSQSVLTGRP